MDNRKSMVVCPICGKETKKRYTYLDGTCSEDCHRNNFWEKLWEDRDNHVFINGEAYKILPDDDEFPFKGFCGREFKIRMFKSNNAITTKNLWLRGTVPEDYEKLLPDDAEFI